MQRIRNDNNSLFIRRERKKLNMIYVGAKKYKSAVQRKKRNKIENMNKNEQNKRNKKKNKTKNKTTKKIRERRRRRN